MPVPLQVSLQRAGWVNGFVLVLVLLGLVCLAFATPVLPVLAGLLLYLYRWRLGLWWKSFGYSGAFLRLDRQGQWQVLWPGKRPRPLILHHVWHASAWITLRGAYTRADGSRALVQYTVWRSVITPEDWRRLQIAAGRRITPVPVIKSTEGL